MKTYKIIRLGQGWYDFKLIPQYTYIKIHGLNCLNDDKAVKRAKKIAKQNGLGYCKFEFIEGGDKKWATVL